MDPNIPGWRRYTFIEPPLILFIFSQAFTGSIVTDFMVYRSCQSIHATSKDICDILHTDSESQQARDLEGQAQPLASSILMYRSLVDGIVPAFLSFFIGPWSDKFGRKPVLIVGYAGSAVSFLLWMILSSVNANPWLYLFLSIPSSLVGGYCGVVLASLCYITDIRSTKDRAWHLTCLQVLISVGISLGSFSGSAVFNQFGYSMVFGIAVICTTLATLHSYFFVLETVVNTDSRRSWCNLFDISLVKDMLVTCVKKRDGFNRFVAWTCITCLSLNVLVLSGELTIEFLFSSVKFGWNVSEYSVFQATAVFVAIIGTLFGAKICKIFVDPNMLDLRIAIFANTSYFVGAMTKALARKPWHYFLSTVLAMFGGLSSPVLRAVLSKSGPPQDAGKIFSLTTSMEAIVPLIATPLYTLVYTRNMPPHYPSSVFLISAGIFASMLILITVMDRQTWKQKRQSYVTINEDIEPIA